MLSTGSDITIPDLESGLFIGLEIFMISGLVVYLVFALVVVRQVNQMTDTLEVGFETPIRLAAWLHLIFAICTLLTALMVL